MLGSGERLEAICAAAHDHQTNSPIARSSLHVHELPHDVLCDIFYACASIYLAKPYELGWICLSHVCRRWREVLLDLPNLWAQVVCVYPDAMDQLLLRARDAPLLLDYDTLVSRTDAEHFAKLLPRAYSILDRQARDWYRCYCHWEALLPGMRLPNLVELEIVGVPHLGRIQLYPETFRIDEKLSVVDAPALLQLRLHGISVSFQAPRLRSLYIGHHHSGLDTNRNIAELLIMLSSYPLLESLTLLHATRPSQDDEASQPAERFAESSVYPDHPINMPRLVELHLGGHPRDLTTLWRSITIPHTASVRFDFTLSLAEPGILITQLMHAVKAHLESPHNDSVTLRARTSQWNFIEGIIGPAWVDLRDAEVAQVPGTCVFNIRFGLPIMLAGQAFAYTLSAFVLAAAPHARTLRLIDYSLGPEPLDFGSSSIRALYVQGTDALQTTAVILRAGQLPELQSAELVTEGDAMGLSGDLIETLQSRAPPLKRLVLRGTARYLVHRERDEELELIRDAVDVLDDQREWEVEDEGSSGKARKLAGLGVALLLSSVTLLQT